MIHVFIFYLFRTFSFFLSISFFCFLHIFHKYFFILTPTNSINSSTPLTYLFLQTLSLFGSSSLSHSHMRATWTSHNHFLLFDLDFLYFFLLYFTLYTFLLEDAIHAHKYHTTTSTFKALLLRALNLHTHARRRRRLLCDGLRRDEDSSRSPSCARPHTIIG